MRLSTAARKLCKTTIEAFNHTTSEWDVLDFKVQLPTSGRWIGRSEDFYNRRVLLCPEAIPENYEVVRIGGRSNEYLIFANRPSGQANIRDNEAYLFEYNIFNAEVVYADLVGQTLVPVASGIGGIKQEIILGSYPVAVDRYASESNTTVKDTVQSKCNIYIPTYAQANTDHVIHLAGETYEVREAYLEMSLTHLNCTKR